MVRVLLQPVEPFQTNEMEYASVYGVGHNINDTIEYNSTDDPRKRTKFRNYEQHVFEE